MQLQNAIIVAALASSAAAAPRPQQPVVENQVHVVTEVVTAGAPAPTPAYQAPTTPEVPATPEGGNGNGNHNGGGNNNNNGGGNNDDDNSGNNGGGNGGNGGSSSGGKKGVAFNDASIAAKFAGSSSWAYNWASSESGDLGGMEYVPMLHNGNKPGNWASDAQAAIDGGSTHLLGFNEPDQPEDAGGCAMPDFGVASQKHIELMNPFKGKAKIGAPGISAGGVDWLEGFAKACNGECAIDFVPVHFYNTDKMDVDWQVESLQGWMDSTIEKVRGWFGNDDLKFWLTEFAYTDYTNFESSKSYLQKAEEYLEGNDAIERYSYFMAGNNPQDQPVLAETGSGSLTPLGEAYKSS